MCFDSYLVLFNASFVIVELCRKVSLLSALSKTSLYQTRCLSKA